MVQLKCLVYSISWLLIFVKQIAALSVAEWFDNLYKTKYDRFLPPASAKAKSDITTATKVLIEFYVESIGNYAPNTMDYDLDLYFIEFWNDFRLSHENKEDIFFNDDALIKQLWLPDVYFANSKSAKYNHITIPNFMLKVQPNGTVRFSARIHMKATCHMNLKAYPLDSQLCQLKLQPYANSEDKVQVRWSSENPVSFNPNIVESDLTLIGNGTAYCDGFYKGKNYSCLIVNFHLKRSISASILSIYMPTMFIVILSWISFWIDPSSAPARVGLAITTLLTFSTQAAGIRMKLPPVSYAKSLDIWFSMCLLTLFATLLEFAAVSTCFQRSQMLKDPKRAKSFKKRKLLLPDDNDNSDRPGLGMTTEQLSDKYRHYAYKLDYISRIVFPLIFFTFAVVYWAVYLLN